jgi:pilus assembly protein CpaF
MSLMRRIERGQTDEGEASSKNGKATGSVDSGNNSDGARISGAKSRPIASTPKRQKGSYMELKNRVQNRLLAELDPSIDISDVNGVRGTIQELFETILTEENIVLTRPERLRLFNQIADEILGFGPLQPLIEDKDITEIMVNGYKNVYVERLGKIHRVPMTFESNDHVMRIIDRIVAPLGRRVDEQSPYVDARLPDGSRVNAVIPPISLIGPTLTIRMFSKDPITVEQLIEFGSLTKESVEFLSACVKANLNIVISGGTGSGKTTLLNVLSTFIPHNQRIVTIENAAELQLRQDHVVTLETRPPNIEGNGEITAQQMVVNSLRMRPDRIIVGEIRSGEALDMLQAMNTGHEGSMTTAHANAPRDVISRIETMTLMAGYELPIRAIREQISSAIDLIVQVDRMRDGSRRVVNITEIVGMEGDIITLTDIFQFEQSGFEGEKIVGQLRSTGLRPTFVNKIEAAGIHLPPSIFGTSNRRGIS